jgi:hypothetical protein
MQPKRRVKMKDFAYLPAHVHRLERRVAQLSSARMNEVPSVPEFPEFHEPPTQAKTGLSGHPPFMSCQPFASTVILSV